MTEKKYTIICGDSAQELKHIADNTIDAVVTDPPYGIEFLGKDWDSNTGAVAIWAECHRILRPGGHLLAFSAARTYHHLATNIESVGFEIRDQLMWIYSSGFPKAQDMGRAIQKRLGVKEHYSIDEWEDKQGYGVNHPGDTMGFGNPNSKDGHSDAGLSGKITKVTDPEAQRWEGWKTALKPAHEPIVMARKRFRGSTIDNVLKHGVGALNIDATRIESKPFAYCADGLQRTTYSQSEPSKWADSDKTMIVNDKGRYPSNVMGDIPEYQKYFYCPKVTRRERHCGYDAANTHSEKTMLAEMGGHYTDPAEGGKSVWLPQTGTIYAHGLKEEYRRWCETNRRDTLAHIPTDPSGMNDKPQGTNPGHNHTQRKPQVGNNHPTVKPVALMRYLIQLVTPPNSHIIDPFTGSGTTGMAATELGHRFTGIEQDPHYVEIANKRIEGWLNKDKTPHTEHTAKQHTATDQTRPFDRLFEQD